MSTAINGGFAFPHESYDHEMDSDTVKPGLTARDYFAAAVAPSIAPLFDAPDYREAARRAYALADALIAERERETRERKG